MDDQIIRSRLLSGERILWSGRPAQGLLFVPSDAFLIPFGLFFLGFSIFWIAMASNAGGAFFLFGIPFVVVGLFMSVGRFFVDAWLRQTMVYAVTDRRILIARPAPFGRFISVDRSRMPESELREGVDGRGTLRFGPPATAVYTRNNLASAIPALDPTPQFLAVDNARQVFDLVQRPAT
ncbi:PH domain-containing protein [Devosia sp. CN2-171]|uniref:PH domain-containing protein n=1 Tax=Devosia sp. CN2-171 TaxID=3400909 RepID=UPI003BF772D9